MLRLGANLGLKLGSVFRSFTKKGLTVVVFFLINFSWPLFSQSTSGGLLLWFFNQRFGKPIRVYTIFVALATLISYLENKLQLSHGPDSNIANILRVSDNLRHNLQLIIIHCVKSVRIRSFFPCFPAFKLNTSVFSPNVGKYGPEKLRLQTFFTQWY